MKIILKLSLGAAAVLLAVFGFVYSGLFNVSALVPHTAPVAWLLSTTMHASVDRRAADIEVPDLRDEELQRAGVNDFAAMCSGCHGAPGVQPEAMGLGLNPRPPDLSTSARHLSDAELFWVTKNGIRMTGMPAWGATHDDDALWPVVAFIRSLPELNADAYQTMLGTSAGAGHHASGEGTAHAHEHTEAPTTNHIDGQTHDDATGAHGVQRPSSVPIDMPATDRAQGDREH